MNKFLNIFFIIITCVILLFIFLHSDFQGGKKSDGENRFLAKMPLIEELNKVTFEKWLNDNIGYRSSMMQLRAYIELKLFNKSSSKNVVIGKDGFLFFTGNENIEIALNKYPYTDDEYKKTSKNLEALNNILEKQNIKFIYTMLPSKVSIYPEKIRGYNLDITETPVDIIGKYLSENIKYINIKPYLLDNKSNQSIDKLYWKTDTHWTYYGAYLGYLAIIEQMNKWHIYKDNIIPVKVKYEDDYRLGDLALMMGGEAVVAKEAYKRTIIENPTFIENKLSEPLLKLKYANNGSVIQSYSNPSSKNDLTVLCIGDSMFNLWNISELFAQTFHNYVFTRNARLEQILIDVVKPDIIIYEAGERTLKYSVDYNIINYITQKNAEYNRISNTINSSSILYNFDRNEYKNNTLILQGWLYDKSDSSTGNVFIRIKDGSNNIREYGTQKDKRLDVAKYFNNDKLIDSGFRASIPVDSSYEILDLILEKNGVYYSISAAKHEQK